MATVTVTATVASGDIYGQIPIAEISGSFDGTLSGTVGPVTVPQGEVWQITGNVTLAGTLTVEGTLVGVDTFTLEGSGFEIIVQEGGQVNLAGVEKSGWLFWGEAVPTGWVNGDRLRVAPTTLDDLVPKSTTWNTNWASTTRPADTADVTLVDASVAKPEVANLDRTIIFQNLSRFHFHDTAGVQSLKWLSIKDSGVSPTDSTFEQIQNGMYSLHFHLLGESARGSVVEGVVIEDSNHRAFVPHGSHGITFYDCVAYNTLNEAYWWDPPSPEVQLANNSQDIIYDHCLAMLVTGPVFMNNSSLSGFELTAGVTEFGRNKCINSAGTCVQGGTRSSAFHWPSKANSDPNLWQFEDNVAHNNKNGIFVWQNDTAPHVITRFNTYRNTNHAINHGAYRNQYTYDTVLSTGNGFGFTLHANSKSSGILTIRDLHADADVFVDSHNLEFQNHTKFIDCIIPGVIYEEYKEGFPASSGNPSYIEFHDCGLVPADFDLTFIQQDSVIEIWESGILVDHYDDGVWT